jgi:hypothetical protein
METTDGAEKKHTLPIFLEDSCPESQACELSQSHDSAALLGFFASMKYIWVSCSYDVEEDDQELYEHRLSRFLLARKDVLEDDLPWKIKLRASAMRTPVRRALGMTAAVCMHGHTIIMQMCHSGWTGHIACILGMPQMCIACAPA